MKMRMRVRVAIRGMTIIRMTIMRMTMMRAATIRTWSAAGGGGKSKRVLGGWTRRAEDCDYKSLILIFANLEVGEDQESWWPPRGPSQAPSFEVEAS